MNKSEFKEFRNKYREFLKSHMPYAKDRAGGDELECRCFYCSDSKNKDHGHMYIHIPVDESDESFYHCFKCGASGIVNTSTLSEWGFYDVEISIGLKTINDRAAKTKKIKKTSSIQYRFNNVIYDIDLANMKLNYINSRLGTNLSFQDCYDSKIIFNLKECLYATGVDSYTRKEYVVDQLNKYFVGFLSLDNNMVNLRRICDEGIVYSGLDKRYINYNIHNDRYTDKYYVLPFYLDLSRGLPVELHMSEGPFDLLSIRYNLRKNPNYIYAAVGGESYIHLIKHFILKFSIFNMIVHVYPDNDNVGSDEKMMKIKDYLYPFGCQLYIHRNISPGEKDMGVPLSRIKESIIKLL